MHERCALLQPHCPHSLGHGLVSPSNRLLAGDKFARVLLVHRNTPDPATGVSPAPIVFGRQLRYNLPTPLHKLDIHSDWTKAAKLREECFMKRHYAKCEDLNSKAKQLKTLIPGDFVYVQDQTGHTPRQWNKSGKVLEALPHDSYLIRIDGSYTTTRRNRKFLRQFTPYTKAQTITPSHFPSTLPLPDTVDQAPLPPNAPEQLHHHAQQQYHQPEPDAQHHHQPPTPLQHHHHPVHNPRSPLSAVPNDSDQQEHHDAPNFEPVIVKSTHVIS